MTRVQLYTASLERAPRRETYQPRRAVGARQTGPQASQTRESMRSPHRVRKVRRDAY